MSSRTRRMFGALASTSRLAVLAVTLLTGCSYGFRGGGGFPSHIRTIYIEAFENKTSEFELEQEVFSALLEDLPNRLGVRVAGRESADAIVRGSIVGFDDNAQNYRSDQSGGASSEVLTHNVRVSVSVEIIDTHRNLIIWDSSNASGQGEYSPMTQDVSDGRIEAVQELVDLIVDQAQSQW